MLLNWLYVVDIKNHICILMYHSFFLQDTDTIATGISNISPTHQGVMPSSSPVYNDTSSGLHRGKHTAVPFNCHVQTGSNTIYVYMCGCVYIYIYILHAHFLITALKEYINMCAEMHGVATKCGLTTVFCKAKLAKLIYRIYSNDNETFPKLIFSKWKV